jgi:hypothetical protein
MVGSIRNYVTMEQRGDVNEVFTGNGGARLCRRVSRILESVKRSGSGGASVKLWIPTSEDVLEISVEHFGPCL